MHKFKFGALLSLCISGTAFAHHGTSGQFDATKVVEIAGVITEMAYINPHSYVYLDVTSEDGTVTNWNCELRAGSVLRRAGWTKEMFAPGTQVEIYGAAARKDPHGCYIETIAFDGGEPIERYADLNEQVAETAPINPALDRTAWGAPDIGGDWAVPVRIRGSIIEEAANRPQVAEEEPELEEQGPRRGPRIEFTQVGQTAYEHARAEALAKPETGRLDCQPRDLFNDWFFDQHPNAIVQTEDQITLKYGFMDTVRTIDLAAQAMPQDAPPRWQGHSIGHWEGDQLIVLTTGFTEHLGRYDFRSDAYIAMEVFSFTEDGSGLHRRYAAIDPKYWKTFQVRTGEDTVFPSNIPYEPYACDDRTIE